MFKENRMHEVEQMAKNSIEHELSLDMMATISGIRGKQFNREIFSTVIPFKDLMTFLQVFPEVQRNVSAPRVNSIKRYILSGVDDAKAMRYFSAITVTARGHIFYDENTQKVAIDTKKSKLSVNDGQHRFFAVAEAIRVLNGKLNTAKGSEEKNAILEKLNTLKEMVIPIVIFNNISEDEEKQLFHDLNDLAQKPSRSATIRLSQTDIIARMSRELSLENRYMIHIGVENDKMSLKEGNPNGILLTTVYECIRRLFWSEVKNNRDILNNESYEYYKTIANDTFDKMLFNLPSDLSEKGKYILEKNFAFKAIAMFIHHCRYNLNIVDSIIFETIKNVNWKLELDYWSQYGGVHSKRGHIVFPGSGDVARLAVTNALLDQLELAKVKNN